ncbi:RecQ-mediated genome instability protein 1 [Vitis vinifera]|uniref:RecQ-mediated genome instability protein 1 n=1 Tax=Vitis vinifera TaxID=29760 RepID=A0A438EXW5_VITVI|nr:RecQ-mediated genome instability protein 1 [Vitis vinifera]
MDHFMGPVTNIGPRTMSWGPKDGTITSRAGDDLVGRELHIREEEEQQQAPAASHEAVTPVSANPNPNTSEPLPVDISDDDFVDVSENFSTPSPPPAQTSGQSFQSSSVPGFASLDVAGKAKLCFEQFLCSDMNYSGAGVLPQNVDSMHLVDLAGPFVLQVDEIVNISAPLRGRYQNAASGIKRCLKLSMTDGIQRVFGMEYRPIKDIEVLAPAGLKIAICNVNIRHGLFHVGALRTKNGVVPPLATRATLAAWPSSGVGVFGRTNSSTSQGATPFQAHDHGMVFVVSLTASTAYWFVGWESVLQLLPICPHPFFLRCHARACATSVAPGIGVNERSTEEFNVAVRRENAVPNPSSNNVMVVEEVDMVTDSIASAAVSNDTGERMREEHTVPVCRDNAVPNLSSNAVSDAAEVHMVAVPITGENDVPNSSHNAVSDVEEIPMVDEADHPLILTGEREIPFTYLASLSAKWAGRKEKAPFVQGKIKCFLTGVKGFQYKQRTTFDLRVYVDDGSLISEILIDHNVAQQGIGYSPKEVTAALASSDVKIVSGMKDTLKQFQIFLANFEGTMVVEINETSPLPIALEMVQGCPASDAWLLLRRLKSFTSIQAPRNSPLEPIDLSP